MSESQSDLTALAFYESVTGEERGRVGREFKRPLSLLAKEDPESWVEALIFLDLHRKREPDPRARAAALTVAELQTWFSDDTSEDDDSGE